jgi:sporulation protein YunB
MRRIRLKRKIYIFKKNSKLKALIIILLCLFVCIYLSLKFINLKVSPILLDYASLESRKLASIIINNAIAKNVTENIDIDELFIITRDSENEIKTIDFNPITVNKILTKVTNSIQVNLKYIEQGKIELLDLNTDELIDYDIDKLKQGIIYEIPTGVIFGSSFLANIGPLIPVKFSLVGDIISYINTKVTDYGINNAVVEINICLQLAEQVMLPFTTNQITITTSIPVAIKLIQGGVPNYYLNGINQNSASLSIPIE